MSSTEVKKEKIPWAPLILLTVIASIAGSAVLLFLSPSGNTLECTYNWGAVGSTRLTILAFIFLVLAFAFQKVLKLNASHLTYLYAIGTIICYSNMAGSETAILFPVGYARSILYTAQSIRSTVEGWWWVVPYKIVNQMQSGGVPVDWVVWMGPIFLWMTFNFSLFIFTSGLSLIFRRRWLDIERIPFPMTMAAHEIVWRADANRGADRNLRPFMIGLGLGIIFQLPIFLQFLFPWFPDVYGWRVNTCPQGLYCPPSSAFPVMQNIVGLATISKDPVSFGLFFLAPLSVSFNVWFWTLLMFVFEQAAYIMGYYTGIEGEGGFCRIWGYGKATLMQGPPYYWAYMSSIGGFIAITAMILFNSRSYLRETINAALAPHSSLSEVERGEATSYRVAYLVLAAGIVSFLLWQISAGIELGSALAILIFTLFVVGISNFYIYAHTNVITTGRGGFTSFPLLVRWGGSLQSWSQSSVMSDFATQLFTNGSVLMISPAAQMMPLKMASLTGTSYRNTFLVTIVAILISTPLILMTKTWLFSIYGSVLKWPQGGCSLDSVCSVSTVGGPASMPLLAGYGTIGFLATFALAMLHARFVWFPFEPLGFVIATSMGGAAGGVWAPFLVAWALKVIVLRVGGSKVYERYGVPIVGGFLAGVVTVIFVGSLSLVVRFFVPF